ncbi:MAG: STAS domain-containing protein [Chitinivibrionales bacterium]|nr:STAS domain-containing protein [Chitinivibrionales bacterium]
MNIERKESGEDTVVFTIRGSLSGTQQSTIKLFEAVSIEMESGNASEVQLDFAKVLYIDSMSIGLLVGIVLKGKEKGKIVRLLNLTEQLEMILEASNLKRAFPELY